MTRDLRRAWDAYRRVAGIVREQFGPRTALTYLLDTKLGNLVRAAQSDPAVAADLDEVAAEARRTFDPEEIRAHLDGRAGEPGEAALVDRLRRLLLP